MFVIIIIIGDHVYFDPVNGGKCDYTNYWTVHNQVGTCYRFAVIEDSSESMDTVRLMLDHNIDVDTFDKINDVLNITKDNWKNYIGEVTILTENDIDALMQLNGNRPVLNEENESTSIRGERAKDGIKLAALDILKENSLYYINGNKINSAGFWTSTLLKNNNDYAFTVTENANNKLIPITGTRKRGIRPVIKINKDKVNSEKKEKTIKPNLKWSYEYEKKNVGVNSTDGKCTASCSTVNNKDKELDCDNNGTKECVIYKQIQGFTMADDKLFFYLSNNTNSNYGFLLGYGESNYNFFR